MDYRSTTPWHAKTAGEIYENLETSAEGLSDTEAAKRLQTFGVNELRKKEARTIWKMLWEQLKDPMILILIGAAILSFVLQEPLEGGVILFIVAVNAAISIIQEKKAEASLDALKELTAGKAVALRQGEESIIPAGELVPGDIVFLEDGAMVPADVRLMDTSSLKIQEASLTGESLPSEKDSVNLADEGCPLGDRTNMAYSSTLVTYGRAWGVVVATGMNTQVGRIAHMIDKQDEFDTPLKRKLTSVGKTLTLVGLVVCALIFMIGFVYRQPFIPLLMTAISLAISIIPEGLPATATIVLALGVQRMAKSGAIIRKLPAVETLGGATVICSDKTGTLTMNQMTVTKVAIAADLSNDEARAIESAMTMNGNYYELIRVGALCNNAEFDPDNPGHIMGDPTEGALIVLSRKFGEDHADLEDDSPRLYEQPFDSERKRMSTVNEVKGRPVVFTKGAIDELLPVCTKILTPEGERPLTEQDVDAIKRISDSMAASALRVLSFAKKDIEKAPEEDDTDVEFDLTFIGLVGMIDPPREEVKEAVKTCFDAGIRTVMITGDHKITAVAIAKELGIWRQGDTVYTGTMLDDMSNADYDQAVKSTTVYARVTPEQKLKIVESLKRTGEIAAMTGDGVNDAPALKMADIGIAMGIAGTDVAKDAADMIITDDNFSTIVDAVKEGRRVYRNIQKVIQFLLAGNISEIITIFIATLFNFPAPLLAVHILWVNLATDTLPALALGVDPPETDVMKRKPLKSGTLFEKELVRRVIVQGCMIAGATLLAFFVGLRDDLASGQAMAFCTIAFSQLFYSYSQRSNTKSIFSKGFFENKALLGSILISAALMIVLVVIPPVREVFALSSLEGAEWLMIFGFSLIPTVLIELEKVIRNRFRDAGE
ncbi:calcium-translocating P-type ATPase, PMCA-type [Faecalicatena contorta]|uniref:P-type Ca(2+) transporter n=1 Tax=Faecalicatena contorta TaxID=39482 RepID=A0A315ZVF6_9FIRM|nr:calcium-translocating P-type ATPase, PMCA-type [Faecalicatena contorta]PWJ49601.1 Ca2+-transporting ATPase [Faecalicatena contorta]SUQ14319.1 Ca2+-transporting ATPase [Faecalicatena contorta]